MRGGLRIRRDHAASGVFLVLTTAFALTPVAGQSPAPLGASPEPPGSPAVSPDASTAPGSPAASANPDATTPPGGMTPLPARIASGTCAEPGDERQSLLGPVAGGDGSDPADRPVYASISSVEGTLDDLSTDGVLVVGGDPASPESAVVCGALDAPRQSDTDLAIVLDPANDSGYTGTAMLHEAGGSLTVVIVVAAPMPEASGSPEASAAPEASPGSSIPVTEPGTSGAPTTPSPAPSGPPASGAVQTAVPNALTSPVPPPTVQPGTSGAPPFSPLPGPS